MDKAQTLKGFRDFLPDEVRKRAYVQNILRDVFVLYGFEPLETPTLEYAHILTGKYGDEADRLLYTFLDRGGRKIGMRYDQTVPLARVVAQYQHALPFPFKRYQIQPVWRAENTQKGRFREFIQCDIDTVGSHSPMADAEIIATAIKVYEKLGFPLSEISIKINNRKNFSGIPNDAIITIDKLDKIGEDGVLRELEAKEHPTSFLKELQEKSIDPDTEKIIHSYVPDLIGSSFHGLTYTPTLARGLDYYTGSIFEVSIEGYSAGSVGGGGRYDNLIGTFAEKEIPAVGFAFGFDRLIEAMDEKGLFPAHIPGTKVVVTPVGSDPLVIKQALSYASMLREEGIATDIWTDTESKMEKVLKYASLKRIPYVLMVGEEEVKTRELTLRTMENRSQETHSFEKIVEILTF